METVTFTCKHCDQVIAVEVSSLGQEVECPHCKQVVTAPAVPADAAEEPPAPGEPHARPPRARDAACADPRRAVDPDREDRSGRQPCTHSNAG